MCPLNRGRFRVTPANKTDVHVKPQRYFNPDRYLCIKTKRTVRNDNTVSYNRELYQIKGKVMSRKVVVEERLNGSLHIISSGGVSLKYREILERPKKVTPSKRDRGIKELRVPAVDHPCR